MKQQPLSEVEINIARMQIDLGKNNSGPVCEINEWNPIKRPQLVCKVQVLRGSEA